MNTDVTIEKRPCGELAAAERVRGGRSFVPRVDIVEQAETLLLLADIPGVRKEDLEINYENGLLTLHGRVQRRAPAPTGRTLLCEYEVGDWHRSFQIGESIDSRRISAELRDGVLTVQLPKLVEHTRRKIEIKAN